MITNIILDLILHLEFGSKDYAKRTLLDLKGALLPLETEFLSLKGALLHILLKQVGYHDPSDSCFLLPCTFKTKANTRVIGGFTMQQE